MSSQKRTSSSSTFRAVLRGMGDALSLGPSVEGRVYVIRHSSDAKAIAGDFKRVGKDMGKAIVREGRRGERPRTNGDFKVSTRTGAIKTT